MNMATTHQTKTNSGNSAAPSQEATMAKSLSLGSVVVNFGTTAKVVGHFHRDFECAENGWPILKAIGADGKPRGGKWVADPDKCEVAR